MPSFTLRLLLALVTCNAVTVALKILVLTAIDTGSHQMSMMPLLKRLATVGHQVNIAQYAITGAKQSTPNIESINLHMPSWLNSTNRMRFALDLWQGTFNVHKFVTLYHIQDMLFGQMMVLHSQTLDQIMTKQWDLVISDELFCPHSFAIVLRMKVEYATPYIFYGTSGRMTSSWAEQVALSRNPVVISAMFPTPPANSQSFFQPKSFSHRLYTFGHVFYEIFAFHQLVFPYYMPNIERFGVQHFNWQELFKGAAVTFSSSLERIGWPVSEGTDLINLGASCEKSNELEGDLKTFVEDPTSKGTIYIAFGTYAMWEYAPEHIVQAFAEGLKHFHEYRIIMSYNGDRTKMPTVPYIRLTKWAPQTAILNHKKTRVFISHGGMKSIKESFCSRTPLIVMPISAEQSSNAHMLLSLGYSRALSKFTINAEQVRSEINEILKPLYQQRIDRIQEIMLDKLMPPLDEAAFYVERAARVGTRQITFKRKGIDLGWCTYMYMDVAALLIVVILLLK